MLRVHHFCVNYMPLPICGRLQYMEETPVVHFSWGISSDTKDARQTAYRMKMSCRNFAWDSGWVETDRQELEYAQSLPRGEEIRIAFSLRDDAGNVGEAYRNSFCNASIDWNAPWIAPTEDERHKTVYLRRKFTLEKPVQSAVLYACGIGYQHVILNARNLSDERLNPAVSDYTKTCCYVTYLHAEYFLNEDENTLDVLLGEGWRRNRFQEALRERGVPYFGIPQLTAMLRIEFQDGEVRWIQSDENWVWGRGAYAENDIFDGETYDANQIDFAECRPVKIVPSPGRKMRPMLLSGIREFAEREPIAAWALDDDSMVLDFGQNIAGVCRVYLPPNLRKGQVITLTHAEELDEDGSLYTAPLRSAKATDTYIAGGDERDLTTWQPLFTYHGFRYVCVRGMGTGFDLKSIVAVELRTDMDTNSNFRCGDPRVTAIHNACVATERANQHGILTDCPQRDERQGWLNDATVRFEETPYNFDIGTMFPKIIRDIMDEQSADGAITCTAPYVFGNRPADPVCSSFLVAGWQSYLHTGNKAILAEAFDSYAAWEHCLLANSKEYIAQYGYYGDWAGPAYACFANTMGDGAKSAVTPEIFMSTGYSYYNCTLLAKFAEILGRDCVGYWKGMAEKIRDAMLKTWYDAEEAKMCTGSQACQVFSLWLGIIPEQDIPKAIRRVHDELTASDYRFTTGNLCTRYLMDMLTKYGYPEDAWTLLTKQDYPSYGYMLQQEATTIWERFELKKAPGMNSHNHPMYGAVDYWFYAYLCGVQPTKAAWEEFTVRPYMPETLMSAQCTIDTVKGEVNVRWMKRYGAAHLFVTVPFGAKANVCFGGKEYHVGNGFHTFSYAIEG